MEQPLRNTYNEDHATNNIVWYENITSFSNGTVPPFAFTLPFERNFNIAVEYDQVVSFGWSRVVAVALLYLLGIFYGQRLMRERRPFELRVPLFVWNVTLATISLGGAVRLLSELHYLLSEFGLRHSVCHIAFYEHHKVLGFWTLMFIYSKLVELGDTVFIVLRKQRLMFLHWYHHITVMLYVYHNSLHLSTTGRWFMSVNMVVHCFMYSYYALKALRFRIPRTVSMAITIGQLMQMVVGIYINYSAYWYLSDGAKCQVRYEAITASFAMYASYFVLFGAYFVNAYLRRQVDTETRRKDKKSN